MKGIGRHMFGNDRMSYLVPGSDIRMAQIGEMEHQGSCQQQEEDPIGPPECPAHDPDKRMAGSGRSVRRGALPFQGGIILHLKI